MNFFRKLACKKRSSPAVYLGDAQFRMKPLVDSLFSLLPQIDVKLDTKSFANARLANVFGYGYL